MLKKLFSKVKEVLKDWFGSNEEEQQAEVLQFVPRPVPPVPVPVNPTRLERIDKAIKEQEQFLEQLEELKNEELKRQFAEWKDNLRQVDSIMDKLRQA